MPSLGFLQSSVSQRSSSTLNSTTCQLIITHLTSWIRFVCCREYSRTSVGKNTALEHVFYSQNGLAEQVIVQMQHNPRKHISRRIFFVMFHSFKFSSNKLRTILFFTGRTSCGMESTHCKAPKGASAVRSSDSSCVGEVWSTQLSS